MCVSCSRNLKTIGLAVEWCVLISTLDDFYRYLTISSDLQLERYLLMRRANSEYVCMYVCILVLM